MCGGIDGPGQDYNTYHDGRMDTCIGCKRPRWMCNCLSAYSKAGTGMKKTKGGLKKRINKNRKLTKPLRKKRG